MRIYLDICSTCDDQLLAKAKMQSGLLRMRVTNPVDIVLEVLP